MHIDVKWIMRNENESSYSINNLKFNCNLKGELNAKTNLFLFESIGIVD